MFVDVFRIYRKKSYSERNLHFQQWLCSLLHKHGKVHFSEWNSVFPMKRMMKAANRTQSRRAVTWTTFDPAIINAPAFAATVHIKCRLIPPLEFWTKTELIFITKHFRAFYNRVYVFPSKLYLCGLAILVIYKSTKRRVSMDKYHRSLLFNVFEKVFVYFDGGWFSLWPHPIYFRLQS